MWRKVKARSRMYRYHFLIRNMSVTIIYTTMATCPTLHCIDTRFQQKNWKKMQTAGSPPDWCALPQWNAASLMIQKMNALGVSWPPKRQKSLDTFTTHFCKNISVNIWSDILYSINISHTVILSSTQSFGGSRRWKHQMVCFHPTSPLLSRISSYPRTWRRCISWFFLCSTCIEGVEGCKDTYNTQNIYSQVNLVTVTDHHVPHLPVPVAVW